jgi:hypothetical protein
MRPVYQAAGNKLTQFLVMIQRVRCHVIVIAHPDEYAKYDKPVGIKVKDQKESDNKLLWTKLVPLSSSKPHSLTMAKYFTDVGWMEASPSGRRLMNFKISDERICGGHFDGREELEKYSFANLVTQIGGQLPNPIPSFEDILKIHPKGEYQPPVAGAGLVLGTKPEAGTPAAPTPIKKGFGALKK